MRIMNWIGAAVLSVAMVAAISCSKSADDKTAATPGGDQAAAATGAKIFKASDPTALKLAFVTNNVTTSGKSRRRGFTSLRKSPACRSTSRCRPMERRKSRMDS